MTYQKQTWLPDELSTPLSAARLTHMEDGIEAAHVPLWADVQNKPGTFPPSAHTHPASEITGLPSGDTILKLTADQAFTAITLANVTGLSFAVTSGTHYRIAARIVFRTAATTTGLKLGATIPAFTVFSASVNIPLAADGAGGMWHGWLTSSGDTVTSTGVQAANTDYVAVIEGILIPSANGTFQLQAASEVLASAATLRPGSHLAYRVI